MGKPGIKSKRGEGEIWDEPKSERKIIGLTPTALGMLHGEMERSKLSASEVVERLIRDNLGGKSEGVGGDSAP
jgi:hypothetical protein